MSDENPYKVAWEREKRARKRAEQLLDEKTRDLYDKVIELKSTLNYLKATRNRLVQTEKMTAIGQLIGGTCNEISEPVNLSIATFTALQDYLSSLFLMDDWVQSNKDKVHNERWQSAYQTLHSQQHIDDIKQTMPPLIDESLKGLTHTRNIISNLQKASTCAQPDMADMDINHCIQEAITMAGNDIGDHMTLNLQLEPVPLIPGIKEELCQAFIHLFANASQACLGQGELTVRTDFIKDGAHPHIRIVIRDNGIGMPDTVRQRAFDPFFTTRTDQSGTGLGLSIVYGVVKKHGGKVELNSQAGFGTSALIYLPITSAKPQKEGEKEAESAAS